MPRSSASSQCDRLTRRRIAACGGTWPCASDARRSTRTSAQSSSTPTAAPACGGARIRLAVLDSGTDPPSAPTMYTPLQLPLKLGLDLLWVSGTLRLAAWTNGPALPAASTACSLSTYCVAGAELLIGLG